MIPNGRIVIFLKKKSHIFITYPKIHIGLNIFRIKYIRKNVETSVHVVHHPGIRMYDLQIRTPYHQIVLYLHMAQPGTRRCDASV